MKKAKHDPSSPSAGKLIAPAVAAYFGELSKVDGALVKRAKAAGGGVHLADVNPPIRFIKTGGFAGHPPSADSTPVLGFKVAKRRNVNGHFILILGRSDMAVSKKGVPRGETSLFQVSPADIEDVLDEVDTILRRKGF